MAQMIMLVLVPAYNYMRVIPSNLGIFYLLFYKPVMHSQIYIYIGMLLQSRNQMLTLCMFWITLFAFLHYNFALLLFKFIT